jgi:energy-coupling factor transporter ATP-binding protein EcfA2
LSSNNEVGIDIRGLRIHYPDRERPAIDGLTESIAEGEVVVITGPSGCGKSTVCRAIGGFIPELISARVDGEITLDGASVWETDSARIAQRVGYIQQDPDAQICTLHVEREVAFGPENLCLPLEEVSTRVDECLAAVGIDHLRHRETTDLSGGEKQRLAIASILAMRPKILLLDEPTANLDPDGAKTLFDLLSRLREERGMTLVIVEHRIRPLVEMGPRMLVLDRGRLVRRHRREWVDPRDMGLRSGAAELRTTVPTEDRLLSIDGLTFGYGAPLFRDLALDLCRGEVLGLIGPNGGGKTTLLRLIAGLAKLDAGRIEVADGVKTGFVFQHPHHQIFERTVTRELLIDGHERRPGELDQWLVEGRLSGFGGVPPLSLSLGEQRRLTLLTALRREPDLLLLDEPFIGQDRRNVDWIVAQIRGHCARGGGVILVSHDVPLVAALAHRILYLDEDPRFGPPLDVFSELRAADRTAFLPGFWGSVG